MSEGRPTEGEGPLPCSADPLSGPRRDVIRRYGQQLPNPDVGPLGILHPAHGLEESVSRACSDLLWLSDWVGESNDEGVRVHMGAESADQ